MCCFTSGACKIYIINGFLILILEKSLGTINPYLYNVFFFLDYFFSTMLLVDFYQLSKCGNTVLYLLY